MMDGRICIYEVMKEGCGCTDGYCTLWQKHLHAQNDLSVSLPP